MANEPECIWPLEAQLGEGPVWVAEEQALWFVDIKAPCIHRFHPATGDRKTWNAPEQVSFLAPIKGGGFVVGLQSGLHRFDPKTGAFTLVATVERPDLGNRLNDGYVDAKGRLWFGSMDDAEKARQGSLYRWSPGGQVQRMDQGYAITNGPAASPDGRTLYHNETRDGIVYAFDLADDGSLSNKREFVRVDPPAHPDGPVVDSEGCLWQSLFGGWGVDRYSPDGKRIGRLELPVSNVTKVAFGGEDLKTLYITTAWLHLKPEDRPKQPLAGGLFAARVATPGLPQNYLDLG
jgi:sugar lactone lactonase YvrE